MEVCILEASVFKINSLLPVHPLTGTIFFRLYTPSLHFGQCFTNVPCVQESLKAGLFTFFNKAFSCSYIRKCPVMHIACCAMLKYYIYVCIYIVFFQYWLIILTALSSISN